MLLQSLLEGYAPLTPLVVCPSLYIRLVKLSTMSNRSLQL